MGPAYELIRVHALRRNSKANSEWTWWEPGTTGLGNGKRSKLVNRGVIHEILADARKRRPEFLRPVMMTSPLGSKPGPFGWLASCLNNGPSIPGAVHKQRTESWVPACGTLSHESLDFHFRDLLHNIPDEPAEECKTEILD